MSQLRLFRLNVRVVVLFTLFAGVVCPALPAQSSEQTGSASQANGNQAGIPTAQDVLAYLNQTINWYRHFTVEQELASEPSDIIFLNDNRQIADQVVRLSFDFAHSEADLLAKNSTPSQQADSSNTAQRFQKLIELQTKSDKQVKQAQTELDALERRLETATGSRRQGVLSAIAETQSELQMAQTRRDVARNMLEFLRGTSPSGSGPEGIRSQIDEMERTIPATVLKSSAGGQNGQNSTIASQQAIATKRNEPSGILALITDLFSLSKKYRTLDETIQLTEQLSQASKELRTPLGTSLREMIQQGDDLSNQPESTDPAVLAQQKARLDAITVQFKQRSDTVLPLVKQRVLLDLYKRTLTNWRTSVKNQYTTELKGLIVRLVVLVLLISAVIAASSLWRRATFHYVQDARRRYQLLLFRRIVLWFLIAVIVAFSFATELGSLATFAGLLTAGVAVALQNVILSVAGYFFLIGKYGVRVGDRVQIAGVTGEVVDIGLVRLHIMELASASTEAHPTGRVVVFSNSVVFQPTSGLFKQIPGTHFVWHEVTLTLAPESNYRDVEKRLAGAVEKVFSEYRDDMEMQRRKLEKSLTSVSVESFGPQHRLRLTQTGLEVVIRYPVDLQSAAAIDDRITREVLDAIDREPKLKLVGSGTPNIQPAVNEALEVAPKR